jgi:hypothetical protein
MVSAASVDANTALRRHQGITNQEGIVSFELDGDLMVDESMVRHAQYVRIDRQVSVEATGYQSAMIVVERARPVDASVVVLLRPTSE